MKRQSSIAFRLVAGTAIIVGLLATDFFGPRWIFRFVGYRGEGAVVDDSMTPSGHRIDVVTFGITPGGFGGELQQDLRFVPRLTGRVGLALSADDAIKIELTKLNCEIMVLPRGWGGVELPSQVPFIRQGSLDGEGWTRVEKPALKETWFVPGPGSTFSLDRFRHGHDYTVRVNLNGRVEPASGYGRGDLPELIPVRLVIW